MTRRVSYTSPEVESTELVIDDQTYTVRPISAPEFFDMVSMSGAGDDAEAAQAEILLGLLRDHMSTEDWDRFDAHGREKSWPLDFLLKLIEDVATSSASTMGSNGARPTSPPAP